MIKIQSGIRVIKNMRLAGHLMREGFVLLDMKPDEESNGKRNIFLFRQSQALDKAMKEYINNKK